MLALLGISTYIHVQGPTSQSVLPKHVLVYLHILWGGSVRKLFTLCDTLAEEKIFSFF